jgi:hypothetical protein
MAPDEARPIGSGLGLSQPARMSWLDAVMEVRHADACDMRTHVTRVAAVLYAAVLVVAVVAFALSILGQPTMIAHHNGPIPDVPCAAGQSPAKSPFCFVPTPPNASKMPDTNVPPDPSKTP